MFKIAKYYMLVNIYKKAKFSIVLVLVSMTGMVLTSFVFSDILSMSEGGSRSLLIIVKWLILFLLIGVIGYHLRKIIKSASLPFAGERETEVVPDKKRERVMEKVSLQSRSERILEKYRDR